MEQIGRQAGDGRQEFGQGSRQHLQYPSHRDAFAIRRCISISVEQDSACNWGRLIRRNQFTRDETWMTSRQSSREGLDRPRLISPRRVLAASRRRCDPRVGFVARREGGGGASASRSSAAIRARAAVRLRSCERCSDASTERVVPVRRPARCSRARCRCRSVSAAVVARSSESCTRESVVLTP